VPDKDGQVGTSPKRRGLRHHARSTLPRLLRFAIEHLLLLPLGVIFALAWVNAAPESYYRFTFSIAFLVNDVGIAFFFALITKEVVEATIPNGVLHPLRRALLPVVASLGATAVPALLHVRIVESLDEPMLTIGWRVALASDLAIGFFFARIIFGRHPAVPFLLLLGIACNALGFVMVALFDPAHDIRLVNGVLMLVAALAIAAVLRRQRVRSFWPYVLIAGVASWVGMYWSGVHPALALVPIIPFLPHAARDPGFFVDARPGARDALSQFELWWRYPAQVALFFFGLVNAGVPMGALEPGTWGLPLALLVGRPLGLFAGAGLGLALGFHLPHRVGWRELIIIGFVAAMGLSVGLFFAAAILPPGQLRSELSMGVLLSLAGAPLALIGARLMGIGRFSSERQQR
jgi:Na+:H+ antiporter, NhaA family